MSRLKNRHMELIQLLGQNADSQRDTKADPLNETNFTVIIFLKISLKLVVIVLTLNSSGKKKSVLAQHQLRNRDSSYHT